VDIETAIVQACRDIDAHGVRQQQLIVSPDQYERMRVEWETWQIERYLRERFAWSVKPMPALNRHERRRARKVRA
jgi:hypothetical protein